jgi:hypothetical protein
MTYSLLIDASLYNQNVQFPAIISHPAVPISQLHNEFSNIPTLYPSPKTELVCAIPIGQHLMHKRQTSTIRVYHKEGHSISLESVAGCAAY